MKDFGMSILIIVGIILVMVLLGLGCVFAVAAPYLWLRIVGLVGAMLIDTVFVFIFVSFVITAGGNLKK